MFKSKLYKKVMEIIGERLKVAEQQFALVEQDIDEQAHADTMAELERSRVALAAINTTKNQAKEVELTKFVKQVVR